MKKRIIVFVVSIAMLITSMGALAGCAVGDKEVLYVAAFNGAYGEKHWTELGNAFEAKTGNKVKVLADAKIEDTITPQLTAGTGPDVIYCAKGRPAGMPEKMLAAGTLEDLTSLLESRVPGSTKTLGETITPDAKAGMLDGGKAFTLPLFVGLNGLFYNADNFYANNGNGVNDAKQGAKWELPSTWEEFLELGAALNLERATDPKAPALFTYPTFGYMDALIPASIASKGGEDKLNKCLAYTDGIWSDPDVKAIFDNLAATKPYIYKNCVVNGQADGAFKQNQQTILDNKTLFMCNGDWVKGEMADSTPAGFNWGTMPYLGFKNGDTSTTRYTSTVYEQIYIPTSANNKALAKEFILFVYSAEGQKIIAKESNAAMVSTVDYATNAKGLISAGAIEGYKGYYDGTTKTTPSNGFKAVVDMPADSAKWNDVMCGFIEKVWGNGATQTSTDWVNAIEVLSDISRAHIKA